MDELLSQAGDQRFALRGAQGIEQRLGRLQREALVLYLVFCEQLEQAVFVIVEQLVQLFRCADLFPYWNDSRVVMLWLDVDEKEVVEVVRDQAFWMSD